MKRNLFNFIYKLSNALFKNHELNQLQNIKHELARRSLRTTVDYVQSEMKDVQSVNSKWKLHDLAISEVELDGAYMEFGVYKAETLNYIASKTQKNVYGFDSFEGLPEFWRDGFAKGTFSVSSLPKVEKNVILVKGWFDDSLVRFLKENQIDSVAYLHVDCDLYSSTKTILDILKTKIRSGTVIVFDEYFNFPGWENDEYKAFQEFISNNNLRYRYITYNYLHEQVAVKIL
jgi:hypothetical protein